MQVVCDSVTPPPPPPIPQGFKHSWLPECPLQHNNKYSNNKYLHYKAPHKAAITTQIYE